MVGIAAHEHEQILDPVGHLEAEDAFVELSDRLHVRHHEGDVAELEWGDSTDRLVRREIIPLGEELDGGALYVLECEQLLNDRDSVAAYSAINDFLGEPTADLAEIQIRRDLERQLRAARLLAPLELQHELAELGGEQGAVRLACRDDEAGNLSEMINQLIEIRRLERGVRYAPHFDHCVSSMLDEADVRRLSRA